MISARLVRFSTIAAAALATAALGQSLTVSLVPEQSQYYAGQSISCVLALDLDGAEIAGGGNISLSGIPESCDAFKIGRIGQAPAGENGEMRWIVPISLSSPTNFTIAPRMSGNLRREMARRGSFFRQYSIGQFDVVADPVHVEIVPVPLADVSATSGAVIDGAVGPFAFSGSLSPLDCALGDLLTLRWKLSGPGAETGLPPAWSPGPGFKAYPPRIEKNTSGALVVSQVVVPLDSTATNAAPFSVSWFDPRSGWTSGSIGPFEIHFHERKVEDDQGASDAASADHSAPAESQAESAADSRASTPAATSSVATDRISASLGSTVVVSSTIDARFAPGAKAKALFEIPGGTSVRIIESHGSWLRVSDLSGSAGWIPAASLD